MTEKPEGVRIAIPADERAIFNLLALAHIENGMGGMNDEKVRKYIAFATQRQGGVIALIDGPTGLEGCLFMMLSQRWYSDDWYWEELCNFVHPDYRRSMHAKNLIQFGKWFAEQMHMPLFIGVLTNKRMQAKIRLYRRQITQGGAVFFHNLNGELNG